MSVTRAIGAVLPVLDFQAAITEVKEASVSVDSLVTHSIAKQETVCTTRVLLSNGCCVNIYLN